MNIRVVDDEACPHCKEDGSTPGIPNRPKVEDGGHWWWRCYNEKCDVGYYCPETGQWDRRSTPEELEALKKRTEEWVSKLTFGPAVEIAPGVTEIRVLEGGE